MAAFRAVCAGQVAAVLALSAVVLAGSLAPQIEIAPVPVSHQEIGALGAISPDGREFCFRNGDGLSAWGVATGQAVSITKPRNRAAPQADGFTSTTCAWSPAGDRVAYGWRNADRTNELRIVDRATGAHLTVAGPSSDAEFVPFAWSPDGQQILNGIRPPRGTGSQLSLVATVGGSIRMLKQVDTGTPGSARFSPDGKFVAYDRRTTRTSTNRDVFVIGVEGGVEVGVAADPETDDSLLAWLQDGRLLVTGSRGVSVDVWAILTREGVPANPPVRLHMTVAGFESLGATTNGRLFVRRIRSGRDVYLAEIDPSTGHVVKQPSPMTTDSPDALRKEPVWSPDGGSLAYFESAAGSPEALVVRTAATDVTRRFTVPVSNPDHVQWRPDGSAILLDGNGPDGVARMFQLDTASGQTTQFTDGLVVGLSPDGRYSFQGLRSQGTGLAKRLVADDTVEMLTTVPLWGARLSPDGHWIAYFTAMRSRGSLVVIPSVGGTPRVLAKDIEFGYDRLAWTPDSRHLIYQQLPNGLHRVALESGTVEPVGIATGGDAGNLTELSLNRDGRRLALDFAKQTREVQVWSIPVAHNR